MSIHTKISNLKNIQPIHDVVNKLLLSDTAITNREKQFLLTLAIILINQYQKDENYKTAFELAYFIVLKYSILFQDWQPLYDLSVNFGFYPISNAIINNKGITSNVITETLTSATETLFKSRDIIETKEQNLSRKNILSTNETYVSYIAPTSFGKSKIIIEHIEKHINICNKFAIIVPTKSLLMQTYKNIKKSFPDVKILIHDEMFNENDNRFIAVFTQERALRLLEKHNNVYFDILYIDEAHKLLENTDRSILLARLVRFSKVRNTDLKILYLSPLIEKSKNIALEEQNIYEYKINFNIKQPMLYEFDNTKDIFAYNRFFNELCFVNHFEGNYIEYIKEKSTNKNFIYLYSPKKIEYFTKKLFETIATEVINTDIAQVINNLNKYVHEDFYVSKYLQKGIIYIHGKIPDDIKDYLEYKFNNIHQIRYLIANHVILEGINLPFDSLFIVDSYGLNKNSLINLIGRVNRLNMVFTNSIDDLSKLIPTVHFVENNGDFSACNMRNKIKLLQSSDFKDDVKNPLLDNFDIDKEKDEEKKLKIKEIINNENFVFEELDDNTSLIKQNMLKLSMNIVYDISNLLCCNILSRIELYKENYDVLSDEEQVFDLLYEIFIKDLSTFIKDKEFNRLKNTETRKYYYKLLIKYRQFSLKEKIALTAKYLNIIKKTNSMPLLYIGSSYGECDADGKSSIKNNVYVNLKTKSYSEIVNLSITKIKLEEDFVSFTLNKFFQLMLDWSIISQQLYNNLVYGTNDPLILSLSKLGLSLNIINRLSKDNQLNNISINEIGNLIYNDEFLEYKNNADDFFKFELNKFLP